MASTAPEFVRLSVEAPFSCNLSCRYCTKGHCANYVREGQTSKVMSPKEAVMYASMLKQSNAGLSVVGLAAPGDALCSEMTYEALRLFRREVTGLSVCVATNGLSLSSRLNELMGAGVRRLSVMVNAISPEVAEKLYAGAVINGESYSGRRAAELVVQNQWSGIIEAAKRGINVKINTVLIPGINDHEITAIAIRAGMLGIKEMRVVPLRPEHADAAAKAAASSRRYLESGFGH